MKIWKVILATLVIFTAGVVCGALSVKYLSSPRPRQASRPLEAGPSARIFQRPGFLRDMERKLNLTPEQRERIAALMRDSQERMKPLRELIDPLLQEELQRVRAEIAKELKPEQRKPFEELLKPSQRKPEAGGENRRHPGELRSGNSNLPPAAKVAQP